MIKAFFIITSISVIIKLRWRDDLGAVGESDAHLQRHVGPQDRTRTLDNLSVDSERLQAADQVSRAFRVGPDLDGDVVVAVARPWRDSNRALLAAPTAFVPLDEVLPLAAEEFRLKKDISGQVVEHFTTGLENMSSNPAENWIICYWSLFIQETCRPTE